MPGGMPGGMGGRRRGPVDNSKFYKSLGVEKTASDKEIKTAYRKLAVKCHPDKPDGDAEKFKEITKAYEILSDPQKRSAYDEGGEDAVSGEGGGGDPSDIFSQMFGGGGGGGRQQQRKRKTKDVQHTLNITLEQLYNGVTKKIAINRDVIDKHRGVKTCQECEGRGVKVKVVRMGPMIQQMQSGCDACGGEGKSFRTKKEREILEVFVEKGAPDGHKIVCAGKADEHPDADPGDVVFTIRQKDHDVLKRKGADLFVKKDITLLEALTGFTLQVDHLDGRKLLVKSKPGEVVCPMLTDPLSEEGEAGFECFENSDSPENDVARAETSDVAVCKDAASKKDFTAFVINNGTATFKKCSREEVLAAKKSRPGATLYVLKDPNADAHLRYCKAVKGEGMPMHKNPFVGGNMFIILNVVFPDNLDDAAVKALKKALPKPERELTYKEDDEDVEIHFLTEMDPVASFKDGVPSTGHDAAYGEDDEGHAHGPGGQRVQCNQQ